MGLCCESDKNKEANFPANSNQNINPNPNINQNNNSPFIKEGVYPNMNKYINFEGLKIIENQKINSICKIINGKKVIGTGFLVLIPNPDRLNQLPVLITCNHVINGNENEIKLIFNDKIEKILKLNNSRKIYTNEKKRCNNNRNKKRR